MADDFISRLFDELRPDEPEKNRVIMDDGWDAYALREQMHPFFINQYISPEALARSVAYYDKAGQKCEVCGDLVTLPVEVGRELLPFILPVTKRGVREHGLPTMHNWCAPKI